MNGRIEMLNKYGLSQNIIEKYINLNIFRIYLDDSFLLEKNVSDSTSKKILNSIQLFFEYENILNIMETIKSFLNDSKNLFFEKIDLWWSIKKENIICQELFDSLFNELLFANVITLYEGKYSNRICFGGFENPDEMTVFLTKNLNEIEKKIIIDRIGLNEELKIKTLEEVGEEHGFTRERARQVEAKAIKKINYKALNDKIKSFYNFKISKKELSFIEKLYIFSNFNLSEKQLIFFTNNQKEINLIKFVSKFYKNNRKTFNDFLCIFSNQDLLDEFLKNNKLYRNDEGKLIKSSNYKIVSNIIKDLNKSDLKNIKSKILEIFNKDISKRIIAAICDRNPNIISYGHGKYQYIEEKIVENDIKEITEILHKNKGLFSADYFAINDMSWICDKYCIENGEALHNFLKKNIIEDEWIKFERMPMILLGYNNQKEFFDVIIKEYSPIKISKLSKILSKDFSINELSLINKFSILYKSFIVDGLIDLEKDELFESSILEKISAFINGRILVKKSEIEDFFIQNKIEKYFSNKNLKKLNYRIESNFIINDDFTVEKLIIDEIKKNKFYHKDNFINFGINDINYLWNLQKENKILRISENVYTDFNNIECDYLNKEILKNFFNSLKYKYANEPFSLNNVLDFFSNNYHFLCNYEEERIKFFILASNEIFLVNKKYNIFCFDKEYNISKILISIINKYNFIYIDNLINVLNDKFKINFSINDIKKYLKEIDGEIYHVNDCELIFKNKECYFEEIKKYND